MNIVPYQNNSNYVGRFDKKNNTPNFKMVRLEGNRSAIINDIVRKSPNPHYMELLSQFVERFKNVPGITYIFSERTVPKMAYQYDRAGQFFEPRIELDDETGRILFNRGIFGDIHESVTGARVGPLTNKLYIDLCCKKKFTCSVWIGEDIVMRSREDAERYANKINSAPNEYLKLAEYAEFLQAKVENRI